MKEKVIIFIIFVCSAATFLLPGVAANVKLTGGVKTNSLYFGILQVYHNNKWGTVCDDEWKANNTKVVCRELGYQHGISNHMGKGSGQIWMDDVICTGSESSIVNCVHSGWGNEDCDHSEDTGITCYSGNSPHLAFRLTDKLADNVGRLEVRYHGTWGTLCADNIGLDEGHVICRMLGHSQAVTVFGKPLSVSSIRFLLILTCNGKENSTEECSTILHTVNRCNAASWIMCKPASANVGEANVAVRLVNGSTPNQGRVEVRYYGFWGTVCDDSWGLADAHVVCRMLNYSKASWAGTAKVSGTGFILLDDVQCRGNEKSLEHCSANDWGKNDCSHSEDAGVKCGYATKEELLVSARLVKTEQKYIGFVEVKYNWTWIPVCDDTWDILDALVICRMLGYKGALAAMRQYRQGVNGLWLGGVECNGDEVSIGECYHRGWTNTRCPGNYYAGVICKVSEDPPPVQVRLEDGSSLNSGRVAVRYGNVWGTICSRGLDMDDAKVICRTFGYPRAIKGYISRSVNSTIWLSNLECNGTESSFVDCRHPGWGQTTSCSHSNDIGLICQRTDAPQFLINGTNAITDSTVVILFNESQGIDSGLQRVYQVAVEKRDNEQRFKSYDRRSFVYNKFNFTMATEMGNDSYITAEILGPISNLTIGDGQYYHGYYNAPLEPGSMYRVHVRIVTMAMNMVIGQKTIYGHSLFVAFTTKSVSAVTAVRSETTEKEAQDGQVVIGLSVAMTVLICVIIGLICVALKLKKTNEKHKAFKTSEGIEIPNLEEMNGQHESHYQPLNSGTNTYHENQEKRTHYENISGLGKSHYQVPKPVPQVVFHSEKQVEEDLYEAV